MVIASRPSLLTSAREGPLSPLHPPPCPALAGGGLLYNWLIGHPAKGQGVG